MPTLRTGPGMGPNRQPTGRAARRQRPTPPGPHNRRGWRGAHRGARGAQKRTPRDGGDRHEEAKGGRKRVRDTVTRMKEPKGAQHDRKGFR